MDFHAYVRLFNISSHLPFPDIWGNLSTSTLFILLPNHKYWSLFPLDFLSLNLLLYIQIYLSILTLILQSQTFLCSLPLTKILNPGMRRLLPFSSSIFPSAFSATFSASVPVSSFPRRAGSTGILASNLRSSSKL